MVVLVTEDTKCTKTTLMSRDRTICMTVEQIYASCTGVVVDDGERDIRTLDNAEANTMIPTEVL